MLKEFRVRYGRNYKVVLAIVLPCLLIVPFILLMQEFKPTEEWLLWLMIFGFLGLLISTTLWLALSIYPTSILRIHENEISLAFEQANFLTPTDFRFNISDIVSFTLRGGGENEFVLVETRNPFRKFQVSPSSKAIEDLLAFNDAMAEISEKIMEANERIKS